ncbi:Inner membrane ABC transporter permease protein YejB [subsurface metagenome]
MIKYIIRRLLLMIPTLLAISIISFVIIQAPPGDFLTTYVSQLRAMGQVIDSAEVESLRIRYGLGKPIYVQYFKWMWGIVRGDLGRSMEWNQPVARLIAQRLPWSILISLTSLLFVYIVAIPIGILRDYLFTFIGFIGIAIPNFLFALVLLWFYFVYTGNVAIGLFSSQFQLAPWSLAKFVDLLKHLWMPAIIVGTAGTCGLIRVMRANLLDELQKPYVMVARAKGLSERKLLYKYPFRIAINPIVSTIGWTLPGLVSGELLVSLVLGLPTIAPLFLASLMSQDMFLAGSIIFILSFLTVIGTLISDILLAWVDPRIKESI